MTIHFKYFFTVNTSTVKIPFSEVFIGVYVVTSYLQKTCPKQKSLH